MKPGHKKKFPVVIQEARESRNIETDQRKKEAELQVELADIQRKKILQQARGTVETTTQIETKQSRGTKRIQHLAQPRKQIEQKMVV